MAQPVLHAIVHGRVQGVGFRLYTLQEAERLGLGGWVRNLEDGTVQVEAQGADDALAAFVSWLQHGPPAARVDRVEVRWSTRDSLTAGFTVRG